MLTLLSLALATTLTAQVKADAAKNYADLLTKHVKNGRVDYKGLAGDSAKLDAYLDAVGSATAPADKNAAIGFYADAYNAIVLRAVLDNNRPRSVLDVKDFFDVKKYKVAGKTVSLNQLEKEILNPFAKDPRTHMILVCGAIGCPILEDKPYAGSDTNQRMDAAAKRYLSGPTGAIAGPGKLELSKIFDWYSKDFGGEAGVLAFAKKYLPADAAAKAGDAPKVTFIDYNWTLNQQ